jgi:hypothetical protein
MKDPFIFEVLDISTCHLTNDDADRLTLNDSEKTLGLPAYTLDEYGWLVYIGETGDNWGNMSPEFKEIMKQASELGCDYIRFDRDGREYDDLPKFEW